MTILITKLAFPFQKFGADESLEDGVRAAYLYKFSAYVDWPLTAFTTPTAPFTLCLNLRLGWRPTSKHEFSVTGQNLLHDQHAEYGFNSPQRVEIERSIYGKVRWQF